MARLPSTRLSVVAAAVLLAFARPAHPQTPIASGLSNPVYATSAPGSPGTLYVVQQGGAVRPVNVATGQIGASLLTLTADNVGLVASGEQGLLGLAFHPEFAGGNGFVYAKYTYNDDTPGGGIRVDQFQVTGGVADVGSRRNVLQWNHDPTNTNHNAGWIGFNPAARGTAGQNQLFVMTGDGGGSNDPRANGQNNAVFQAKVLRVDVAGGLTAGNPTYTTPADNSPAGIAAGRPEIYATGLRNPYRASFDRANGNLYIGDVGQNSREEVNFIPNGAAGGQNFGWRLREGTIATPADGVGGDRPSGNVDPIFEYLHSSGLGRSITGGYVYRGTARDAQDRPLDGAYVFGDFVSGRLFSLKYDGVSVTEFADRTTEFGFSAEPGQQKNWSSFAEDGFGNLYGIDYNGAVFLIVPVPEPAAVLGVAAAGLVLARAARRRFLVPAGAGR